MSDAPDRGDIVWLSFDPQTGREQSGRRLALILSPLKYNAKTNLALACPITSQVKGYPFEVAVPDGLAISGVILSDQVKSLDWKSRRATLACRVPSEVISQVLDKVGLLLSS